jgi:thiamine-phosphate pyrophosphorylase
VNDRADIARIVSAAGIHLPAAGMRTPAVRELVGPDVLIGRSAHSADEALAAYHEGADYVFLGPIWPTASHPREPGLGVAAIAASRDVPVIAIGGITPDRVLEAVGAGASGVAAISALWTSPDPGLAIERMLLSFDHE